MSHNASMAPPRYVPQISIEPPEERVGRGHINLLLTLACLYVHRFASDLSLLRHCEPLIGTEPALVEWIGTAVRDAALQVHHFGWALRGIRATMKACPTLRAQVDHPKLREAVKAFDRDFADAVLLRHAVSHLGEQLSTPQKMAELHRPGEFLAWETTVGGYFTMASSRGRQVKLHVHEGTLDRLRAVLVAACDAFAGADPTWEPAYG